MSAIIFALIFYKVIMTDNKILVAKIISVHGIKGAVKIQTFTCKPKDIFKYAPLYDADDNEYNLKFVGTAKNDTVIAKINDINDRNIAENLKGIELFATRNKITNKDEILFNDLIGFTITSNNEIIGIVTNILNYGAGDILEITKNSGKTALISFNKYSIKNVNKNKQEIEIDKQHLVES